jgi:hypothetical protein
MHPHAVCASADDMIHASSASRAPAPGGSALATDGTSNTLMIAERTSKPTPPIRALRYLAVDARAVGPGLMAEWAGSRCP